jgi:hypothetical protein
MRGVYEATIRVSALAAQKTLLYITAPSSKVVEILSASVTNESNVTNQQLETTFQLIGTLGAPTGTALTPSKLEQGDQASGSTVVGNVTASEPTYTANTEIGREGWASLAGYRYQPVPEERLYIAPSTSWGLRMLNTTPTAFDCDVRVVYREIG